MPQKSKEAAGQLVQVLQARFEAHMPRHAGMAWDAVSARLAKDKKALAVLQQMEATGGEPDAPSTACWCLGTIPAAVPGFGSPTPPP